MSRVLPDEKVSRRRGQVVGLRIVDDKLADAHVLVLGTGGLNAGMVPRL
jgi:hypothetical protein